MKYTVAVRTLCEFTAKRGDLDLRFTPSATALEGMAGHALVAASRGERYETEITLRGERGDLVVRGRADGFDPERGRLEEIKTYRGDLAAMPANRRALHWAQALVYGALLCAERGLAQLEVALVYFDVATQHETSLCPSCGRLPTRTQTPKPATGSSTLAYIDSWKVGSSSTGWTCSSDGSSRRSVTGPVDHTRADCPGSERARWACMPCPVPQHQEMR